MQGVGASQGDPFPVLRGLRVSQGRRDSGRHRDRIMQGVGASQGDPFPVLRGLRVSQGFSGVSGFSG